MAIDEYKAKMLVSLNYWNRAFRVFFLNGPLQEDL